MSRKKNEPKALSPAALTMVAARFKLLGEPARLALLNSLMTSEQNVNELVENTGLSQANVSKHLSQLADAGYVNRRKEGLFTVYSIADDSVFQLCDLMCSSIAKKLGQDLKAIA
ncbi:MAG: winged helix-turn-helix transcriptional regulator [Planctomycetes bacterium]|nr:winged helix-turn-helix transcriptional regulator [Planctomycetota bacterium]MCA8944826.1 winged helix-turn-helix transcriptional regulator [Planctomycetota bacterium]